MRLPFRASSVAAALAVSLVAAGCRAGDVRAAGTDRARADGAERGYAGGTVRPGLMGQEVPRRSRGAPRPDRPTLEESEDLTLRLPPTDEPAGRHAFYWTRAIYSGGRGRRGGWGASAWATDFPKGDRQFMVVLKRLVRLDAYDFENAVSLADPNLRRFPMIYAVEVGFMDLTPEEIHGLRDYLAAGGLLVVDDFWGTRQWEQFERNMRVVLPGRPIVELPLGHPLFRAFYDITEVKQVPNVGNARRITYFGQGSTSEQDGYVPHVRAILDDRGEIMVLINWNTDLGDAWEWAEDPMYPLEYSTFAYEMGANMIVYGMSH